MLILFGCFPLACNTRDDAYHPGIFEVIKTCNLAFAISRYPPGFCQMTLESRRALLLSRSGEQPFLMEPSRSAKVGAHLCSRVSSCQGHHCNYCPSQVESQAAKLFPMLACLIIMGPGCSHLSQAKQRGLPEISL